MPNIKKQFNKNQLDSIKRQAETFWTASTNAHQTFFDNTSDRERMAHSLLPQSLQDAFKGYPDRSKLAPPDFLINLASLRAAVSNLIYGSKPFGMVSRPGNPDFVDPIIEKAEAVLQYNNDMARDDMTADEIVYQALFAGVGCGVTRFTRKFVPNVQRDSEGTKLTIGRDLQYEDKLVASYVETVPIDIRRVRVDPRADRLKDRRICGHQSMAQYSDLIKHNKDENHFYNFNEKDLWATHFSDQQYYEYTPGENMSIEKTDDGGNYGDKPIELRQIRGMFRVPYGRSMKIEDLVVHLGNDMLLGAARNNLPIHGWEMYNFATVDSELSRLHPAGVVECATDMWIYLFLLMNHVIDRANRDTYDMYVGDKAAMQGYGDNIEFDGGGLILLDTMAAGLRGVNDAFQPMRRSGSSADNFNLIGMVQNIIQQMMKLTDYIQGVEPSRKETATAVEALMQGGQSLLMHLVSHLKFSFFEPSWQKKLILWNFFNGYNEDNRVIGRDRQPLTVNPGEIDFYWNVDIDTNANRDRPSAVRRLVEMFPTLQTSPHIDQYELVKTAVQVLGVPNQDRIVLDHDLIEFTAFRENEAMLAGVQQPVHPQDQHEIHLEVHGRIAEQSQLAQQHIAQHQMEQEAMAKGIGNTKELGGATGNNVASYPAATKGTGTGSGIKSEGRA